MIRFPTICSVVFRIGLAVCLVLVSTAVSAQPPDTGERLPSIDQLAAEISSRSAKIRNIVLKDCDVTLESTTGDREKWELQPECLKSSLIILDGKPDSRFRIEIKSHIMRWTNGVTPWVDAHDSAGFDGKEYLHVFHTDRQFSDAKSEVVPSKSAVFSPAGMGSSPGGIFFEWSYHRQLVPNFMTGQVGAPLSTMLLARQEAKLKSHLSWDTWNGLRLIRIDFGSAVGEKPSFWVEPAKGYVVRKVDMGRTHVYPDGSKLAYRRGEALEVAEAAPDIWYPTSSVWIMELGTRRMMEKLTPNEKMFSRFTSKTGSVVINDPSVTDDSWLPKIPPMYSVTDHIRGEWYKVAPDGREYREKLDERVGEARAKSIAAREAASTRRAAAGEASAPASGPPSISLWRLLGICFGAGLSVIVVFQLLAYLRRRGTKPTLTSLMLATALVLMESGAPVMARPPTPDGPAPNTTTFGPSPLAIPCPNPRSPAGHPTDALPPVTNNHNPT